MGLGYRPGLVGDLNIQGTTSNDTIIAGPNDTIVSAGAGNDYVFGEDGNDTLNGNQNNDFLFGQSGSDSLTGGGGADFLAGGIDADTLTGGSGADIFFFGAPFDEFPTTVDTITDFQPGIDKIQMNGSVFGIGSTDFDSFSYNSSTGDLLFQGTKFAVLPKNLNFVPSRDINIKSSIQGTISNDTIITGPDSNIVSTGSGNDYVLGEDGNDTLNGNEGDDFLFGENGNDTLNGNQNNDFLFGQSGSDSLTGGGGADFLAGGIDADTLIGGGGADKFFFGSLDEVNPTAFDNIRDFQPGVDKIQVDSAEFVIGSIDFNKFSYNSSTGTLLFDGTQFAQLQSNLSFVLSRDIEIVRYE